MSRPADFIGREVLLGWVPRHVTDVTPEAIAVEEPVMDTARKLVTEATGWADSIADGLERACHELASVEDSGLSGAFRRLIAVAIVAHWLKEDSDRRGDAGWEVVVGVHRAVQERWPGATYDLSNCLACLQHLPLTKHDAESALGNWVWLTLPADERSLQLRWAISTRRFEPGLGREILARSRARLKRRSSDLELNEIPAEQAEAIAREYMLAHPELGVSGSVVGAVRWQEIGIGRRLVYAMGDTFWQRQWVVYLSPAGENSSVIRSSMIVAVDRFTGEVGYAGSAHDEG